ncbi:sensor histidine kinase [Tsukamurella soli]|uniref:histidine kinase n=1 Tax=Tsukamurella soli TaxID=644556 RepID=A0ABP8KIT1_9ACTN
MRWLEARYRRAFALLGYEYPPSYMFITDAGLLALVAAAVIPRVLAGPHGWQWLWLALACALAAVPTVACLLRKAKMSITLHTVLLIAASSLYWLVPAHTDVVALILVLGATAAAAVNPPRRAVAHLAAFEATVVVQGAAGHVPQAWLFAVMVCFGAAVGYLLQYQLLLLRSERQAQSAQAAVDRARIAGEVHDVVAHSLSVVLLNVTAARRALESDDARDEAVDALRDAEQQGRAAMTDVRRTIELLRADGTPDGPQPGLSDLPELVASFHRSGSVVALRYRGPDETLTSATELAAFRVVQESLSNAVKHAPGARVDVTVGPERGRSLAVRVCNPVPPDTHRRPGGSGLAGMRARVESVGGTLRAGPADGAWRVDAAFPAAGFDANGAATHGR